MFHLQEALGVPNGGGNGFCMRNQINVMLYQCDPLPDGSVGLKLP